MRKLKLNLKKLAKHMKFSLILINGLNTIALVNIGSKLGRHHGKIIQAIVVAIKVMSMLMLTTWTLANMATLKNLSMSY